MKTLNNLQAVLFDLDGTLLPMDQETFLKAYLPSLAASAAPLGNPREIARWIMAATGAVLEKPHGDLTCEDIFWQTFLHLSGGRREEYEPLFTAYYLDGYRCIRDITAHEPRAAALVAAVQRHGWNCVLATLPAFPALATHQRVKWAGLSTDDFDLITTYENSHATKPHIEYYREILDRMGWDAARCLMVGNDVGDDMAPALALGMGGYYLDVYPENRCGVKPCYTWRGDYDALLAFFEEA